MAEIRFENPTTVPPPVGSYSHVAIVPAGSELLSIAGQVGNRLDGTVPAELDQQYELALCNLVRILESQGASPRHIVKINTYFVTPLDYERVVAIRRAVLGDVAPSATLLYVQRLASPDYLVEVDALAVKPQS